MWFVTMLVFTIGGVLLKLYLPQKVKNKKDAIRSEATTAKEAIERFKEASENKHLEVRYYDTARKKDYNKLLGAFTQAKKNFNFYKKLPKRLFWAWLTITAILFIMTIW